MIYSYTLYTPVNLNQLRFAQAVAQRQSFSQAAHLIAVENLPIFTALVLVAHLAGISNVVTAGAAALYFFGMLAHYLFFTLGIPYARTLAFLVAGFGAELALAFTILGWI